MEEENPDSPAQSPDQPNEGEEEIAPDDVQQDEDGPRIEDEPQHLEAHYEHQEDPQSP